MTTFADKIAAFNNVSVEKISVRSITQVSNGWAVIYRRIRDDSQYLGEFRAAYISDRLQSVTSDHCMRDPSGGLTYESDLK